MPGLGITRTSQSHTRTGITDHGRILASPNPTQTHARTGTSKPDTGTVAPPKPPSPVPGLASPYLPATVPQATALPKHPSHKPGLAPPNSHAKTVASPNLPSALLRLRRHQNSPVPHQDCHQQNHMPGMWQHQNLLSLMPDRTGTPGEAPRLHSSTVAPRSPPAPHLQQLLLPHMRTSRPPQQMVQ